MLGFLVPELEHSRNQSRFRMFNSDMLLNWRFQFKKSNIENVFEMPELRNSEIPKCMS